MKNIPSIGIQIADILLPDESIDSGKWAVIACDQFTSEPEYWQAVEEHVGNSPSTLNLILPEVYLEKEESKNRAQVTQQAMQEYLDAGLLKSRQGFILVRRTAEGKTRHGLMLALDLERYNFNKGSQSLIRATEGTIVDRLPPRIKIRKDAILELPHILVLIDDPQRTVIEPLAAKTDQLDKLYDFDLMLGSGHLEGYAVSDADTEQGIINALEKLADPPLSVRNTVSVMTRTSSSLQWATAIILWQPRKRFGKRSKPKSAWITPPATLWWRLRMFMMRAWNLSPSTAPSSISNLISLQT